MNQLIERMLAVGAGFAPVNRPGLVIHIFAVERDVLAIALHRQLLKICGKAFQVLFVGQNRHRLRAKKVVIPNRQESHEHRQVFLERRVAEMLVHFMKASEHRAEIVRSNRQHCRKTDGRIHRVASADPVPEAEHVRRINAERGNLFSIRGNRHEMLRHGFDDRRRVRPSSQSRALCALVMVSSVVKVFDETMNSVSAASRSRVASTKSVPSTFDTKRNVRLRSL